MKANHVPGKPKGMLGALLDEQKNSDWFTDDHIRGMLIDIVIAGMNGKTISVPRSFTFYLGLVLIHCNPDRMRGSLPLKKLY